MYFWMLYTIVSIVMMWLLGTKKFQLKRNYIRQVYRQLLYRIATVVYSIVFVIIFTIESWDDVLIAIAKTLASTDSREWAVILLPFAIIIATAIYATVIYYTAFIAAYAKLIFLRRQRRNR